MCADTGGTPGSAGGAPRLPIPAAAGWQGVVYDEGPGGGRPFVRDEPPPPRQRGRLAALALHVLSAGCSHVTADSWHEAVSHPPWVRPARLQRPSRTGLAAVHRSRPKPDEERLQHGRGGVSAATGRGKPGVAPWPRWGLVGSQWSFGCWLEHALTLGLLSLPLLCWRLPPMSALCDPPPEVPSTGSSPWLTQLSTLPVLSVSGPRPLCTGQATARHDCSDALTSGGLARNNGQHAQERGVRGRRSPWAERTWVRCRVRVTTWVGRVSSVCGGEAGSPVRARALTDADPRPRRACLRPHRACPHAPTRMRLDPSSSICSWCRLLMFSILLILLLTKKSFFSRVNLSTPSMFLSRLKEISRTLKQAKRLFFNEHRWQGTQNITNF